MDIQFSDEPLGIEQDFESWQEAPEFAPPPPAGKYRAYIDNIRNEEQFGEPPRYRATLDLRIVGGKEDARLITWVRLSNKESDRKSTGTRSSMLLDLIKSAGVSIPPRSNKDFHDIVNRLKEMGPSGAFGVQIDWRGFCTNCYEQRLKVLTGKSDIDSAKALSSNDERNKASEFATKARNFRAFEGDANGNKKDTFICKDCGEQVRAQVNVTRFMRD